MIASWQTAFVSPLLARISLSQQNTNCQKINGKNIVSIYSIENANKYNTSVL